MAGRYLTKRLFKPRRGIDLKSSENNRGEDYLTNAQNVMYDENGNLCKRNGYQLRIYGADAASGLVAFDTTDYAGNSKSELIILGNSATASPLRVVKNTLTITNTLINASVTFSVIYDETTLQYRMVVTGGETASIAMGLGVGDLTVAGLIAALPLTQTGVASGDNTVPAAFIGIKQVTIQPGDSDTFEYYTAEEITWGGYATEPSTTVVSPTENPSYAVVNGSLYWYRNHDSSDRKLYKYDGHTWYEVSFPKVDSRVFKGVNIQRYTFASGSIITDACGTRAIANLDPFSFDTEISIWARTAYKDKAGVMHYGEFKERRILADSTTTPSSLVAAITGYATVKITLNLNEHPNYRSAIADGQQNLTLVIDVDNGHSIIEGDVIYFFDYVNYLFIERLVTDVTATTITISADAITAGDPGGNVSILDNATITNNYRMQFFHQTQVSSTGFYENTILLQGELLAEVPAFSSTNGTMATTDPASPNSDITPIVLVPVSSIQSLYSTTPETYIFDGARRYPPPEGKFVASASNGSSILCSGDPAAGNIIYSSSSDDCESFFIGRNSFTVEENVTALGSSGSVAIIGTKSKTYAVTGDIPSLNFRVEKITDNLGIRGHATVAEVDEGLLAFNTIRGTFSLAGGRELRPVGEWPSDKRISIIEPFFTYRYPTTTTYCPNFDVASLSVVKEKKLIINSCPSYFGSTFGGNDNITWIYDYSMGGWFVWFGVDMSFGSAYWDGKVWCAGHSPGGGVDVFSMNETNSDYDYSDHGSAIHAVVQYNWEAAGDSNIYKKYQWLTIYTPPGNGLPYNIVVKTYANYEISKSTCFNNPTALHTSFEKYATPPAYTVEGKLRTGKMCSLLLEISNDSANEGLWLGGTEMDIAPVFQTPSRSGRSDS